MIFAGTKETEDMVIEILSKKNEVALKYLFEEIAREHPITLQAVYKAVNKLIDQEVIVKSGKKISLSKEWVQKVKIGLGERMQIPQLNDGDYLSFSFNSFIQLDTFWKHLMLLIQDEVELNFPVFLVNPHEMFIFLRPESQREYLTSFSKKQRYAFITVGDNTLGDKEFKHEFENDFFQVNLDRGAIKERHKHMIIIGDFVSETIIDKTTAQRIDDLYEKSSNINELSDGIKEIFASESKVRIRLNKNFKRANRLRKHLAKPFFIPQEVQKVLHFGGWGKSNQKPAGGQNLCKIRFCTHIFKIKSQFV